MPTLIAEDGSKPTGANAYSTVAQCDSYVDGRPYGGTEWAAQSADGKARCLIMATLMIDSLFLFPGYKATNAQVLQWPRVYAINPDSPAHGIRQALSGYSGTYFADNEIPAILVKATCEQALQLAIGDRTGGASNEGIQEVEIFEAIRVAFSSNTEASPAIPSFVQAMLSRIGNYQSNRGGAVKLQRT